MPPRTYRDLTPEELASLQLGPRRAVPPLPAAPPSGDWRVRTGGPDQLRFLGGNGPADDAIDLNRTYLPETTITAGTGSRPRGLSPAEEALFQRDMHSGEGYRQWFDQFTAKNGGAPNLNDPDYDYRAAWKAGIRPSPYEHDGGAYHWASSLPNGEMLKGANHPTAWMEHFMRQTGVDPNDLGLGSKDEGDAYLAKHESPETNAWLDELIARPTSTPPRAMVSAAAPNGGEKFTGEDTPEARDLIKQRGMRVTGQAPPSDADLLDPNNSQREATTPDLGGDQGWLDELIATEGGKMDREQQAAAQPPRRTREDIVSETLQPPTRAQGWLAALGDIFGGDGGHQVDNVNARAQQYQHALAQARMQDVAAGEHADDQAAERAMMERRLGITERGQDLAQQRADDNQWLRWLLAKQGDTRARELQTQRDTAGMERAQVMANSRADAGAPDLSPEQRAQTEAGWLHQQVNDVPLAKVEAYLAGNREGIAPGQLERLDANHYQWRGGSQKTQQGMIGRGTAREGATPDSVNALIEKQRRNPKEQLALKDEVSTVGQDVKLASDAWAAMSPSAKRTFATLAGAGGDIAQAVKNARLSPQDQVHASQLQALADVLIKARSGSAVTGSEWNRIAQEIGWPTGNWDVFNSPERIDAWLGKTRQAYVTRVKNIRSTYGDLWGQQNAGP